MVVRENILKGRNVLKSEKTFETQKMKIGTNVNLGYPFRIPTVVVTHTFDCSSTC